MRLPDPPAIARDDRPPRVRPLPVTAAAIALGFALDAVTDGPPGIGLALWIAVLLASDWAAAGASPRAWPFIGAAFVPAVFLFMRASPPLSWLNVLASAALAATGAGFAREGVPLSAGFREYLWRCASIGAAFPQTASTFAEPVRAIGQGERSVRTMRASVVVVPIAVVFAVLLGSADAVFAHYLRAPVRGVDVSDLPEHLALVSLGGITFGLLLEGMRRRIPPHRFGAARRPGAAIAWRPTLAVVDLIFAGFVAIQLTTFFGGRTHVLSEEGLTYAEYARSGFWQLLAAAGLSGLLLLGTWAAGGHRDEHRSSYTLLATTLVGLNGVVLASALGRLSLYEHAYGFTWPRLIGHAGVLVVGTLLVCGAVAIIVRRVRWLPTATLVVLFAALVGLNVVDPDRFIADHNIDRWRSTGRIDSAELAGLSADAAPSLVTVLPELGPCDRAVIVGGLVELNNELQEPEALAWSSWNLARDDARAALEPIADLDTDRYVCE